MGAATRGECGGSASSKAKASPRGRASYRRAKSVTRTAFFCGEARPAANAEVLPAQKQKLRPEVGPPTEESKCRPRCFCGSRDPAAKAMVLSAQKAKASPRGRASYRRAKAPPRCFCGRRAPRRMRDVLPLKSKASPRGRASYRSARSVTRTAFRGSRAPRRMRRFCPLKSKSFAPRSGLLQKSQKRHPHRFFLWEPRPAANQASEPLSRAVPRSVRRARRSRRRRAETGYARLVPRQPSEPRPRLPPAAFQGAIQ